MRPKKISIPKNRPYCCAECPLLGRRPAYELPPREHYTMRCFLPDSDRVISGRGSKQPNARNRCKKKEYNKAFATNAGDIEVSEKDYYLYKLDRTAWLYERDRRLALEEKKD